MLTNDALNRLEKELAEIFDTYPYATQFEGEHYRELVKMARRYIAWRDGVLTTEETPIGVYMESLMFADAIPAAEEFDAAIDSAVNSQRKEGGEG